MRIRFLFIVNMILAATLLGLSGALSANPNDKDLHVALAIHGKGTVRDLALRANALSESGLQEARSQLEAVASQRGGRLSGQVIGRTRVQLVQLSHLAQQLEIYGEPAGVDFTFRIRETPYDHWFKVIKAYAATPNSQKFVNSIRLAIQKQTPARMKTLEKIQKLVAEQKWQTAENELYGLFDNLEAGTCFLSDQERQDIERPFAEVRSAIDTAMRRIRSQEAAQLLGESRKTQTPDFTASDARIREAVAAVAASGMGTWNQEPVTGPQLVGKIGGLWAEVHVACLHCRALDWSLQRLFQQAGANATRISPDPTSETLQRDYAQFSTSCIEAVISLIRADAARFSATEVPATYNEYLAALAPLARQVADDKAVQAWDAVLKELAAKSGPFAAEVQSYAAATDEMLRWRARVALSQAQSRSAQYPTLDKVMYDATVSREGYQGLFPVRPDGQLAPRLLASAPAVLTEATPRLVGKQATAFDVVRVTPTSSSSIARYRARTYANVPATADLAAQISSLKSDLLVTDSAPPLSLATATSLYSADRGDLAAVGGDLVGHHLEAVITRFASLPNAAHILVPLGVLPREDLDQDLLPQMLMRFDLQPTWVQHDHFFAEL